MSTSRFHALELTHRDLDVIDFDIDDLDRTRLWVLFQDDTPIVTVRVPDAEAWVISWKGLGPPSLMAKALAQLPEIGYHQPAKAFVGNQKRQPDLGKLKNLDFADDGFEHLEQIWLGVVAGMRRSRRLTRSTDWVKDRDPEYSPDDFLRFEFTKGVKRKPLEMNTPSIKIAVHNVAPVPLGSEQWWVSAISDGKTHPDRIHDVFRAAMKATSDFDEAVGDAICSVLLPAMRTLAPGPAGIQIEDPFSLVLQKVE